MLFFGNVPFILAYDDPDPKDPDPKDPDPKDPDPKDPDPKDPDPNKELKFSQDDINSLLNKNKQALREENAVLLKSVEGFQKSSTASKKIKDEMQDQIQDLRKRVFSKDELLAQEKEKLEKERDTAIEELTQDRNSWQKRFTEQVIDSAIIGGAAKAKAVSHEQILAMLRPGTTLTEVLSDDGDPTGEFVPMVKFAGKDKDGKPKELQLTVDEAIKQMKDDLQNFGNLFASDKKSGFGGSNDGSGSKAGPVDYSKMDLEQYRKAKADGTIKD